MTTNTKQILVVVPMLIFAAMFELIPGWINRVITVGILMLAGIFIWQTEKKDRKKTKPSYPWMD